jgi:RNA polymerase sigma factor (TIGR02999 family)
LCGRRGAVTLPAMGEITELLQQARGRDPAVLKQVYALLFAELKRHAQLQLGRPGQTLSPTVLVNESYLRLAGNAALSLNDRHHFLACAAAAMRAIWVDHVRRSTAQKRGSGEAALALDSAEALSVAVPEEADLLALDQALDRLDQVNPRQRELVELRWFAGLEFAAIAELLEISERTAKREWERARAFLHAQLG